MANQQHRQTATPGSKNGNRLAMAALDTRAATEADGLAGAPAQLYNLPFGMQPAPTHAGTPSQIVDLGDYDAAWSGWKVVFDEDITLSVYNDIRRMLAARTQAAEAQRDPESAFAMLDSMENWIASICLAWNFTNKQGQPIPQPREGGAVQCPLRAYFAIAKAFVSAVKPPKA